MKAPTPPSTLIVYGRNPLLEALNQGQPIEKIYLLHHVRGGKIERICREAKRRNIPVARVDRSKLDQLTGLAHHQGVAAVISPIPTYDLDAFIEILREKEHPPCVIILDRIQDPHNMGAIIRSAEFLGADGLIFSPRDNVPLNPTVVKTSAGALFHLPICKTSNLVQTIQRLKASDFWIYGGTLEGELPLWEVDLTRPCGLIIGNEDKGIRPLIQKHCDQLFVIPRIGQTDSLNASVAAGIMLWERLRQKRNAPL